MSTYQVKAIDTCKPELAWVKVEKIICDNNYQRDIVSSRLRKILKEFNWRYFQPVTLSPQDDGTYAVLDGQHRVEAARLHPDLDEVPAIIVVMDGLREEADTFVKVNTSRTAVSAIDKYYAGLIAEDPTALMIKRVCDRAGCGIAYAQGKEKAGQTNAVTAVGRAANAYGEKATAEAMRLLSEAWPKDKRALKGTLINGLARVIRCNDGCDLDHMCAVLRKQDLETFTANFEAIRKIAGGSAEVAIAKTLAEQYNRGKRVNLLTL